MTFCFASSLDAELRYGLMSMVGMVLVIAMMLQVQMDLAALTMAVMSPVVEREVDDSTESGFGEEWEELEDGMGRAIG